MNVAQVAPPWYQVPPLGYGGIEAMLHRLVNGLVERDHRVTLVGAGPRGTDAADFVQTYSEPPSDRIGEPLPEVVHAAVAEHAIEERDPEIVHDHSLAGPLLAYGRKAPTVVTAHGPVGGEFGEYYERISRVVAMVAISDAQRELNPNLSWVGTVYNGTPIDDYPFTEGKDDYAVWLGRMNPSKGTHLTIDAAREAGIPLKLAGKCSEPAEERYFQKEVAPRLEGDDVEWIGEADMNDKRELLPPARCLIFPIQWDEPFGIVMVEAMACGTPVVALGRGSVPEVVIDGETGFVRDDVSELAEAITRVDELDPQACRDHAKRRFDIDAMVSGYEEIYRSLLDGGRG